MGYEWRDIQRLANWIRNNRIGEHGADHSGARPENQIQRGPVTAIKDKKESIKGARHFANNDSLHGIEHSESKTFQDRAVTVQSREWLTRG